MYLIGLIIKVRSSRRSDKKVDFAGDRYDRANMPIVLPNMPVAKMKRKRGYQDTAWSDALDCSTLDIVWYDIVVKNAH
jgi:hypothetical protein